MWSDLILHYSWRLYLWVSLSNGDKSSAVDNPDHVMCICHVGLDLSVDTCMQVCLCMRAF